MKTIDIWIKARQIAERVEHETTVLALACKNRGQQQIYDNIIMDTDQLLNFRTYFKEAVATVQDKCSPYTRHNRPSQGEDDQDTTRLDEDLYIILHMPDQFPDITAAAVDKAIYNYLIAWVIFRWLEVKLPQEAQPFRIRAEQNLSGLSSRLERRTTPFRRPYRLF